MPFRFLPDEREDVQKKTFAKWFNSQLQRSQEPPITDLFYDLRDGTKLLALIEVLTNTKHVGYFVHIIFVHVLNRTLALYL